MEELAPQPDPGRDSSESALSAPRSAPERIAHRSVTGSLTGLWIGSDRVEVATGLCLRGTFLPRTWAGAPVPSGDTIDSSLNLVLATRGIARTNVVAVIPSELLVTRYLHLPSVSQDEIASMVPFQLRRELPVSLAAVTWTAIPITLREGGAMVRVEIMRLDALEAWLGPVNASGVTVSAAIPEGDAISQTVARAIPAAHRRAFLVEETDAFHYLVQEGTLLQFHRRIDPKRPHDLRSAVSDVHATTGERAPEPICVLAATPSAKKEGEEFIKAAGLRGLVVTARHEHANLAVGTAVAHMTIGAGLLPPRTVQELARLRMRSALMRTAALIATLLVLWSTTLAVGLDRDRRRIESLEMSVSVLRESVSKLNRWVEQAGETVLGSTELLSVMGSIGEATSADVRIHSLRYSEEGRVTFSGESPTLSLVDALSHSLRDDSFWERVEVIRTQKNNQESRQGYGFEVVGDIARE